MKRREALIFAGGMAVVGSTALTNRAIAQNVAKDKQYSGAIDVTADKVLLYVWNYEYYGAVLDLYLYWYRGTSKFCIEGKLTYARVVKVGEGDLCVEQDSSGDFKLTVKAEIKIGGRKVAKFDATVISNVDWNERVWKLKSYDIEVCGTNISQLRCKVWREEYLAANIYAQPSFTITSSDSTDDLIFLLSNPVGATNKND
jgi:hypothetical protein